MTLQVHAVHAVGSGASRTVHVSGPDGARATFRLTTPEDDTVTVTATGTDAPRAVRVAGGREIAEVDGGAPTREATGPLVQVPAGTDRVRVTLQPTTT